MDITSLISNLGFPIAMCLLFYVDFRKVILKNTEAIILLTEKLRV